MWCERDGVAVCTLCLVAGPHKDHKVITIEKANKREREAARVKLAQVEAAMGEVEAAMGEVEAAVEREAASEAGEQESAREARAAIKQHFDRMREAVAQRERALGAEVDEWERTRIKKAAKRRAKLAEIQTRLAAAGKALQQQQQRQQQQRGRLGRSASSGDSAAACQAARTAASRGTQASSNIIAFASEDTWTQVVASSGRLEQRTAGAGAGVSEAARTRDYAAMTAAQHTLEIGSPVGVAVDTTAGHIVVADSGDFGQNGQVWVVHAADGSRVRTLATTQSAQMPQAPIRSPWGVAVDHATGHIAASDHNSHRVHVWRSDDGSFVRTLGSPGSGPGQFQYARGVAVDKEGQHVFVADSQNHRVQVWRADGSFVRTFGSEGSGPGQFQEPAGVAVDKEGQHVFVADSGNHRVQVWRPDGSFLCTFGSPGDGPAQFAWPTGVAVDATGHILVADRGNKRVQVW